MLSLRCKMDLSSGLAVVLAVGRNSPEPPAPPPDEEDYLPRRHDFNMRFKIAAKLATQSMTRGEHRRDLHRRSHRGFSESIACAISMLGPKFQMTASKLGSFGGLVKASAEKMSQHLGHVYSEAR